MLNGELQLQMGFKALAGLLDEFRQGNIVDLHLERNGLERHLKEHSEQWDRRFPGFPTMKFPYTSIRGQLHRGKRDKYLKNIIVKSVADHDEGNKTIINPICVLARHTRDLACRLPDFKVIGTDINPRANRMYEHLPRVRNPKNFEFIKDDIFEPQLKVSPTAVVFFGACGSLTDAAMDYAIESKSPYLMCRTCCHENIGGNTKIKKRFRLINWFFRSKNWGFSQYRKKEKYNGFYFSDKYTKNCYPRSYAAQGVSNPDEFLEVGQNSTDSDICRAIIDLDRYLFLVENGYDVWYRGELFVAKKQRG